MKEGPFAFAAIAAAAVGVVLHPYVGPITTFDTEN